MTTKETLWQNKDIGGSRVVSKKVLISLTE
jgi:hypothetical protein